MSLLLDRAPLCVFIEGQAWDINADFRTAILFEQLLKEPDLSASQQILQAVSLFYPVIPTNLNDAINQIIWFYHFGKETPILKSGEQSKLLYDYEQDAEMIYAAFSSDYNIDLEEIKFLHWWKFKALFENLRPENLICKVIEYRGADLKKLNGEQKTFYAKMQRLYAVQKPKALQEKENKLNEILLNGGDIASLNNTVI